jgi:4-methylaminobutanoate oxidase (formaldehyde-forming)
VALTEARKEEIYRQATLARAFDVEVDEISPDEVKAMYPHLNIGDVVGAVHLPLDGQCDPANIAMALAKGARQRGAKIVEGVKVTAVHQKNGRVAGVGWTNGEESGTIEAEMVVNCGGMWARDLAAASGVTLPLHACEHFYIVTEGIEGLSRLPVLRVPDECAYYKDDAGKDAARSLRTQGQTLGHAGDPRGLCLQPAPRGLRPFRADPHHGNQSDADARDRGHTHLLQRSRELHAGRSLLPRRGAGTRGLLGSRRLQFDRNRLVGWRRHGARAMDERR